MQPTRTPPLASQNGEDYLLLHAFAGQQHGFFVDVGAFDGIHLSNSWALEQAGWRGYCIEPTPSMFARLVVNRPQAICVRAAVSSHPGQAELHVDPTMLLSSIVGDDEVRTAYRRAAEFRDLHDREFASHTVDVITLDDLLRKHAPPPDIDVVSIDVEGAELAVLEGFDLEHHRPRVLVIEANTPDDRDVLVDRCDAAGYTMARRLGNNYFFALENELTHRLSTARIHCFLPRNLHPRGIQYTHPEQRHDRILLGGSSYGWDDLLTLVQGGTTEGDVEGSQA